SCACCRRTGGWVGGARLTCGTTTISPSELNRSVWACALWAETPAVIVTARPATRAAAAARGQLRWTRKTPMEGTHGCAAEEYIMNAPTTPLQT
ncbi:MAG: hypothetical protein AAFR60_08260, partial [Pseudomonadota bacterium]